MRRSIDQLRATLVLTGILVFANTAHAQDAVKLYAAGSLRGR